MISNSVRVGRYGSPQLIRSCHGQVSGFFAIALLHGILIAYYHLALHLSPDTGKPRERKGRNAAGGLSPRLLG